MTTLGPLEWAIAWRRLAASWPRSPQLAQDVLASSDSWSRLLSHVDSGEVNLSPRDVNRILDELARQIDCERDAARRALEARIERELRQRRGR